MKKVMAAVAVLVTLSVCAYANEPIVPAWVCNLSFAGQSKGVQVIVGKAKVQAAGRLTCVSAGSEVEEIPVNITLGSSIVAPRVAIGKLSFVGQALEIGLLTNDPADLLGSYAVVQGQAAIGIGAGVMVAAHTKLPALSIKIALQFTKGLGINAGLTHMKIEAAH